MEASRPGAIRRLVQVAAEQRTLEGIREMLRVVTEEMNGWCTLILGASPGCDPQTSKGRLFVLAYWVPDQKARVWHEISMKSLAGCVLRTSLAGNDASGRLDMTGRLVEADLALIEQCTKNLLGNAAKYSFDNTKVRIWGGIQSGGTEFFISVANEGLEIGREDIHKIKQRGQRSDRAIQSAGEGSGIGLWLVDEIMQAHGGRLAITPTTNGVTEVKLVFPVMRGLEALSDEAANSLGRR